MHRIATLLALAAASLPAAAEIDRAAALRAGASVLKIEAVDVDGRFHVGSGVVVADGTIVTNCHVTRRAARTSVVRGGVRWNVARQSSDVGHDLCLLRVPGIGAAPAPIASSASLRVGQPLLAIGYTGGAGIQLSEGDVIALHELDAGRIIRSSNGFTSGASGGGLFTADGELVGILTFRLRGGEAHYFSAPVEWLRGRIGDDAAFVAIGPLEGSTFWEQPSERQPFFLRAATLEQGRSWQPLLELANARLREEPRDAEAAYMRAVADEGLGRDDEALTALKACLDRDPGHLRAWQRVVRLHRRLDRHAEMRQAIDRLSAIDPKLARELADETAAR